MLGWELPPHNSGGLGVACYHLSKALAQQGATIDFVLPYTAKYEDIDFLNIHSATELPPFHKDNEMSSYGGGAVMTSDLDQVPDGDVTSMRGVQKQYVKYIEKLVTRIDKPDVIHVHDWLTMEAGMRAKQLTDAPLVVHVHATEFDRAGASEAGNPIIHEIEYNGLMMADRIIAVSNITKGIIIHKYHIPADKIEVAHNAIDPNMLVNYDYDRRTYKYLELLKDEGYTIVSTLTRFTAQKGLVQLMNGLAKACEKYDKFAFLLAGDGEQRDELIRIAADNGIAEKVYFTGFVRGKQWRDAYRVSDVFVMSSVSEPFGLTALEAAHYDNALIVTNQSGVGEVLDTVYRYDFWDTHKLADELVSLATSRELLNDMKRGVKSEYARISWDDVARKCMEVYKHAWKGVAK